VSKIEKVVTIKRLGQEDPPWMYWRTRSHAERLEAVEKIRKEFHGWTNESEPRLSRIYRIIHLA